MHREKGKILMDKKLGVYLCSGCSIGDSLEIDALEKIATSEYNTALTKNHPFLCSDEGVDLIKKDIKEEEINTVVIAACSPRVNYDIFRFGEDIILERVNLREHVAWCQKPKDEDTQMLGEDYLRMGIVKAQKSELPDPFIAEGLSSTILVIGGGITGMTSALEAANTGTEVILVEKEKELGGWSRRMHAQYPKKEPSTKLKPTGIPELEQKVQNHEKIKIFTSAEVAKISEEPGIFEVMVKQGEKSTDLKVGSIVLATGWNPYDATKLTHLKYGQNPNIITNVQMEEMVSAGGSIVTSDGKAPQKIAFIQCAGSRDQDHLPYCSSVCCMVSLKQAIYCREQHPESKVFIFHKDIRTPGQYEDFYRQVQDDERTFLTKSEIKTIEIGDNGVIIEATDTLLGENIKVAVDMVVLATGMVPSTLDNNVLNLDYRQGPELPTLKYGFPDSHFICFPYETQRTGIYAAGCVRAPLDLKGARSDGTGAAFKAIQAVELVSRGQALLPRVGDRTYPEFFMQRCTDCKRCTEECPFGSIDENEKGTPLPHPNRCRRCGICMGSCPERIISFKNYSVEILASMIKAIEVPDEFEEKPRILAFVCENDAYPAMDLAGIRRLNYNPHVRAIPVRCIGSVNNVFIADALSKGIDGILLIGCKHGDDYQCHFIKGSELLGKREENLQETLQRLMLEPERIRAIQLAITEYDQLATIFSDYVEEIEDMGYNPFKGM
jgi:quinone-modifying oxidoreductase subunit QmoB